MRKEEQRVWDTMKRNAPADLWMERVENMVGDGMPDLWIGARRHCWVELKAAKMPKRATTPLLGADGLRTSQTNWHRKARARNLPVYTLTRDDQGGLYLVSCEHSDELNAMPAAVMAQHSIASNWVDIFKELTREN